MYSNYTITYKNFSVTHMKNVNHIDRSYSQDFYRTTKWNGTIFVTTQSTMCFACSSFSVENVSLYKSFKQIDIDFSKFNPEVQRTPRLEEEEAKLAIRNVRIVSDGSCFPEDKPCTYLWVQERIQMFRRWISWPNVLVAPFTLVSKEWPCVYCRPSHNCR